MPYDFPLAVVFAPSTSGRFEKLKVYRINFQVYKRTEFNKTIIPFRLLDMRLVIANEARTISYPTRADGTTVKKYIITR